MPEPKREQICVPGLTICPSCRHPTPEKRKGYESSSIYIGFKCTHCNSEWIYETRTGVVEYSNKNELSAYIATVTILIVKESQDDAMTAISELLSDQEIDWHYAHINSRTLYPEPREWDTDWHVNDSLYEMEDVAFVEGLGWTEPTMFRSNQ